MSYRETNDAGGSVKISPLCICGKTATQKVTVDNPALSGVVDLTMCLQHAAMLVLSAEESVDVAVQPWNG